MLRKPKVVKTPVTVKARKSVTLDWFLEGRPDIRSLKRLEKMRLGRRPISGAFSTDRIVDIVMDAGTYWSREEAEKGMYSFLKSAVRNGTYTYGWAPLVVKNAIQGYYIAEPHGREEELETEENEA
ncbi:hypothetical protein KY360_05135 [Candidatus Woesearchaeota archaeon]|nr:hypothetical protein [Candidatus Woesearchaeota archaeon]